MEEGLLHLSLAKRLVIGEDKSASPITSEAHSEGNRPGELELGECGLKPFLRGLQSGKTLGWAAKEGCGSE